MVLHVQLTHDVELLGRLRGRMAGHSQSKGPEPE